MSLNNWSNSKTFETLEWFVSRAPKSEIGLIASWNLTIGNFYFVAGVFKNILLLLFFNGDYCTNNVSHLRKNEAKFSYSSHRTQRF